MAAKALNIGLIIGQDLGAIWTGNVMDKVQSSNICKRRFSHGLSHPTWTGRPVPGSHPPSIKPRYQQSPMTIDVEPVAEQ
jgi:hypothetical protein